MTAAKEMTGMGSKIGTIAGGIFFVTCCLNSSAYISTTAAILITNAPSGGSFLTGMLAIILFMLSAVVSMGVGGLMGALLEYVVTFTEKSNDNSKMALEAIAQKAEHILVGNK